MAIAIILIALAVGAFITLRSTVTYFRTHRNAAPVPVQRAAIRQPRPIRRAVKVLL